MSQRVFKIEKEKIFGNLTPGKAYVAEDHLQPGAAFFWAINDGSPSLFAELSSLASKGAIIRLVTLKQARDMMRKWKKPERKKYSPTTRVVNGPKL